MKTLRFITAIVLFTVGACRTICEEREGIADDVATVSYEETSSSLAKKSGSKAEGKVQRGLIEVLNKSNGAIKVSAWNSSEKILDGVKVERQKTTPVRAIDATEATILVIVTEGTREQRPYMYTFEITPPGDIFVTFNPAEQKNRGLLYPQTGTFKGLSGKSQSGYSLKKNIKKQQITRPTQEGEA